MTAFFDTVKLIFGEIKQEKAWMQQPCNLQQMTIENNSGFDYSQFLDDYGHEMCTMLAFYLHDHCNLKVGAIKAIDQNDEGDVDYQTIVHQFVYLTDDLVLDARGIDTEDAMLTYYEEKSLFDDEDWDFMVDSDYQHDPKEKSLRNYDDDMIAFNGFFALLDEKLKSQLKKQYVIKKENCDDSLTLN
jgi:hypothetical protein